MTNSAALVAPPMTAAVHTETLVLFPTFGHLAPGGRGWIIPIRGAALEYCPLSLQQRFMLRVLRQVMKAKAADLETPLFHERIRDFISRPLRERELKLRVGARSRAISLTTSRSGQFNRELVIPRDEVRHWERSGVVREGWLPIEVSFDDEAATAQGQVQLLEPGGVSVISDIDDTIKHTGVMQRREMLLNTFLREFRPVSGMAELYRRWASSGAVFHYVSSSPWQLFSVLSEYRETESFPSGSIHLRSFRLRDHMLARLLLMRGSAKKRVISSILKTFPERKFVLVGDCVEKDPEIYGAVARKYPRQVTQILIRNLPERKLSLRRAEQAFRRIDDERVQLFRTAAELEALGAVGSSRG